MFRVSRWPFRRSARVLLMAFNKAFALREKELACLGPLLTKWFYNSLGVMSVSFFSKFLKNETNMTLGCTELGNREWLPPVCLESGAAKRAFGGI